MERINRRSFIKKSAGGAVVVGVSVLPSVSTLYAEAADSVRRPNILFAMADDWSWPHAGVYGDKAVQTPAFDRVARSGCLFTHTYAAAPQCSPNRAAILTGRSIWQLEEAGTHSSYFPQKFAVYPELLEAAGYHVGCTGKLWGPGNWKDAGRSRNPAGPGYNKRQLKSTPAAGIGKCDYSANFNDFFDSKPEGRPFCFWYGCREPHRSYEIGSGLKSGRNIGDVVVPPFLPDDPVVRGDILDYYLEIEWFDRHLGRILQMLENAGELENTLIVVTSDNGMPFPRAKANLYEYGTHMPMAVCWPSRVKAGRTIGDFISFIDFAPTFLDAAGLTPPAGMSGRSFLDVLLSDKSGRIDPSRDRVFTGRERHSHSRFDNLGYPSRAIRTSKYLYVRNFKPDRWPAGDPEGYCDIDGGPTKDFMMKHRDTGKNKNLFELAFGKRPADELYDIAKDPACTINVAERPEYAGVRVELQAELERLLKEQKDPRVSGTGDVFESYPRFGVMRDWLGGFHERGVYNPKYRMK